MPKPKQPIYPSFPPLPTPAPHFLIISRCRHTAETWWRNQDQLPKNLIKPHFFYYPDNAMAWRDRQQDCQVIVLEQLSDSPFFREEVGRIKLYFSAFVIFHLYPQ
jgi:hypothetical protein